MNQTIISTSTDQTKDFAKEILKNLEGNIIALIGELGSGKTTFSQGLGEALEIKRMISPTYILLRQYSIPNAHKFSHLYHADLYRVNDAQEALDLGLEEIWLDTKNLLLIEWPETILNLLPQNTIKINFEKVDDDQRKITITH